MVSVSKESFRRKMLEKRDAISELDQEVSSREIGGRLNSVSQYKDARTVAFYMSKGSEVLTLHMIASAFSRGKEVLLPVTTNNGMSFHYFTSFHEMTEGKFGILEPLNREPLHRKPDVVIVPGICFDKDLHRLGYGKGYYDKYFAKAGDAFRIGLCYDSQIVDKLPKHEHDQRMDLVVTETMVLSP